MAAIDRLYRSILLAVRFFSKGWGPIHAYESLARFNPVLTDPASLLEELKSHRHPVEIQQTHKTSWGTVASGQFLSPVSTLLKGLLPPQAEIARFQLLLPKNWKSLLKPVYIHLAGTGDHGFTRRRNYTALPLLKKEGLGSLILENPFYGSRKPPAQTRSQLLHVSDLFVLGLSLMLECVILKLWLEEVGLGPVGVTGASMGGHNCSLSASIWPESVPVVPFLSWSTASSVFTQGMLSGALCWNVLEEQLLNARTSSEKSRKKIFDFALEQQALLRRTTRHSSGASEIVEFSGVNRSSGPDHVQTVSPLVRDMPSGPAIQQCRTRMDECASYHSWLSTKRGRNSTLHKETVDTLAAVLDLSTHLHNYPLPRDTSLARFVVATDDLYIPRQHIASMVDIWPGCEVQYVPGGHVSATVMQQHPYQQALVDKMKEKTHVTI